MDSIRGECDEAVMEKVVERTWPEGPPKYVQSSLTRWFKVKVVKNVVVSMGRTPSPSVVAPVEPMDVDEPENEESSSGIDSTFDIGATPPPPAPVEAA